ncbi:hypothetical protein AAC387_Pa12g1020 [Persea americana]
MIRGPGPMPIWGGVSTAVLPPGGPTVSVSFGWSVLPGEAEVLPPTDLVLPCLDEPVCRGHEILHGGYGVHDLLRPKLDARAQGQLKGFHCHLLRNALDLAINSPETTGELGEALVLSHPEGHQVSRRVRGSIIQGEPWDVELLREGILSDLPRERRRAHVFNFKGAALVSGDTSILHILASGLLDLLVNPLLKLLLVFWYPPWLFWLYMPMVAARVFFSVDPITPLIIEDVPQVPSVAQRSLAVLGWRTRSMATPMKWASSPTLLLKLLFEPLDKLVLLLNEAILSSDLIQARVFVFVRVNLMVELRSSPC